MLATPCLLSWFPLEPGRIMPAPHTRACKFADSEPHDPMTRDVGQRVSCGFHTRLESSGSSILLGLEEGTNECILMSPKSGGRHGRTLDTPPPSSSEHWLQREIAWQEVSLRPSTKPGPSAVICIDNLLL